MKKRSQPLESTVTGEATHAADPVSVHKHEEIRQTEEEEGEDLRAPLELMMKFLGALTNKDFHLAAKLCQMILICEPDNPEASEFLPLIQTKLLKGDEREEEEEDDDDNSESDGTSSTSSCSLSSYSSSSSDDDDDNK